MLVGGTRGGDPWVIGVTVDGVGWSEDDIGGDLAHVVAETVVGGSLLA